MTAAAAVLAAVLMHGPQTETTKVSAQPPPLVQQPALIQRIERLSNANTELLKINARTAQIAEHARQYKEQLEAHADELARTKAQHAVVMQQLKGREQKILGLVAVLGLASAACWVKSSPLRLRGRDADTGSSRKGLPGCGAGALPAL